MSGRRRRGNRQRATSAFTILALAGVVLLAVGGLAATLTFSGDSDDDIDDPPIVVTPGETISELETAVARDPTDTASVRVLAEVLANSGRIQESIPWFERAVADNPADADLRVAFGRALLRLDSTFDAELQLREAVEIDPRSATAAFYLAQVFDAIGPERQADAVEWYGRVIELDPGSFLADDARARLDELGAGTPAAAP